MRATLRRSCDACAKAKHSCDLQTPRCSRCNRRATECVYANEPLTWSPKTRAVPSPGHSVTGSDGEQPAASGTSATAAWGLSANSLNSVDESLDPFDTYPPTRLPRMHVQRLIYHFLSTIAFQYYPLDLDAETNPFVVSWWPLALADPALFHVSIQTASLDEESRAQRGFPISDLLMVDSVSLVRQKVDSPLLAFRDDTLSAVVTLAAIEHGKGNTKASSAHIQGVKRMVNMRGGIDEIKRTSPLTARMVPWVSMLVMESPQFPARNDSDLVDGITAIPRSQMPLRCLMSGDDVLDAPGIDPVVHNIVVRLRSTLQPSLALRLTGAELHDLACFVLHKLLLLSPPPPADFEASAISECLRYGTSLYMLVLHGTTYYSHANLAVKILSKLRPHLISLAETRYFYGTLGVWVVSVCMAATPSLVGHHWLRGRASEISAALKLRSWGDVLDLLNGVIWAGEREHVFRGQWHQVLGVAAT